MPLAIVKVIDHFHHYFMQGVSQSELVMVHYGATACLNVEIKREKLLDDYKNCKIELIEHGQGKKLL